MKVAIIGAGISGLSCAFEFKKHGIIPAVFEKKSRIGEDVNFVASTIKLYDTTFKDPLKHLKDEYNIELKPLNVLRQTVMYAPNSKTIVNGTSGYIFSRGEHEQSLEYQMASIADVPIIFNKHINIEEIRNEYDYVIDATGTLDMPKKLVMVTPYLNAYSRIAEINGSFDVSSVSVWFNTEYAKNCYCFLLPYSNKNACLILTVNDISHSELDFYWDKFLTMENMKDAVIWTSDVSHELGAIYPHKAGNIYFTGNSAAVIESTLGIGMFNCIETGNLAARSIIEKLDYEAQTRHIFKYSRKMSELRKLLNTFDNEDYDRLITLLGMPVIKQLIYKNPFAKVIQGAVFIKAYNKLTGIK
ncbi:MAG TPA: NAD(P)-binding protein [Clostridia bacterium]|nr:NAD(P)-binding protein [Clostridia bacterium]